MAIFQPDLSISKILYKWLFRAIIIILIIIFIDIDLVLAYRLFYRYKIYPGVKIGNISLGGLTKAEAGNRLALEAGTFTTQKFLYGSRSVEFPVVIKGSRKSTAGVAVELDLFKTIDTVYSGIDINAEGRQGIFSIKDLINNNINIYRLFVYGHTAKAVYEFDDIKVRGQLAAQFKKEDTLPENAKLVISSVGDNYVTSVIPEQTGHTVDIDGALDKLRNNLDKLEINTVYVDNIDIQPQILSVDTGLAMQISQDIMKRLPVVLKVDNGKDVKEYSLDAKLVIEYLEFKKTDNGVSLGLSEKFKDEFLADISNDVRIDPQDGMLQVVDGKVIAFGLSKNGIALDIDKTFDIINKGLVVEKSNLILMATTVVQPRITSDYIRDLGINELVGVGKTSFAGSPKNRRHNIKIGAKALNGILIKPTESFSLVKALGKIDAKAGYLTELVIKTDRTVPEFGGGLCQIATTIFRTTLNAGLPVIERRNHSYRVVYYEPAGVDATIYDPYPDYKFLNDTSGNILIQTKIIGNDLIIEFWGTKDSRVATQTKPKISNIVQPLPTKIIETPDLPVGKKECVEKAHDGADAEFVYTVTYPNGQKISKLFKSKYKPWRAVCLVGQAGSAQVKPADISVDSSNKTELLKPVINQQ